MSIFLVSSSDQGAIYIVYSMLRLYVWSTDVLQDLGGLGWLGELEENRIL